MSVPAGANWLSLKVLENASKKPPAKPQIHISVPKKIVPLATRRNRIKRLIREAVRKEAFFGDAGKVYLFRVLRAPAEKLDLWDVKKLIVSLRGVTK